MRLLKIAAALGLTTWMTACGGGGHDAPPPPAPTATLSASPTSVASGADSTLTWTSTDATACAATGGWTGSLAATGTQDSGPLNADTTFSLTCSGAGGTSTATTATVTLIPLPTVTLTVDQPTVAVGGAATLTWASTNAMACTASGAWAGDLGANGTQSTGALASDSSFTIMCTGPGGSSAAADITVTVTMPVTTPPANGVPTVTLTAVPTVVTTGGASSLSWSSTNSTACTGTGGTLTGTRAVTGTLATGALTATTAYSLTCSGPGGSSAPASATVTVSATTMTVAPTTAALTLTRTQQFTATVPGGGLSTWMVDGVVGGSAASGTISGTGLYTAGTTAGTHAIVATSAANATDTAGATVGVTDLAGVYTYHNNNSRDGTNPKEYLLTTATVGSARFGKVATCVVDGVVVAQPLWAANVVMNGVKHNVVYAATEHDGLHAFEADSSPCAKLWSVNLIDAAHGATAGETTVASTLVGVGAGDIQPEIGVTGTPVIDPVAGILYVVSKSVNAAKTTFYQRLHAIDIVTGAEKAGSPILIAGTYPGTGDRGTVVTFNTKQELQRAGLALVNGLVYVSFTAHEDSTPWYGWMMSYQYGVNGLVQKSTINVAPNAQKGGIWMSGGAPAADAANQLYVITGNGTYNPATHDYGDSLLKLSPDLTVSQWFTPADQEADASGDVDFGSGGATILADLPAGNTVVHALICGGKDSKLYVLNRDMLGNGVANAGIVQQISFNASIFATGAFWNNALYLGGVNGSLQNYKLNTANANLALASSSTHKYGFAGATPSVSSNALQNGIVWSLDTKAYCTHHGNTPPPCGPAVLLAHDAANVATELWNSSLNAGDAAGYAVKFTLPTIANGRVYVGTRGNSTGGVAGSTSSSGQIDIYGLKQ